MERIEGLANIKALGIEIESSKFVKFLATEKHQQAKHFVFLFIMQSVFSADVKTKEWGMLDSVEDFEKFVEQTNRIKQRYISVAIAYYAADPLNPYYMLSHGYRF